MLMDPVGRGSRWRADPSAPKNYDDNANYCGGFWVSLIMLYILNYISIAIQMLQSTGKCGLCGDPFSEGIPRKHELGGKFGQGVVVKTYRNQKEIDVSAKITANHLGHFSFEICNLDKFGRESEDCFAEHKLSFAGGEQKYPIGARTGLIKVSALLPKDLKCDHCVLRWTYKAGNNWGVCEDGSGALGCGMQETFINCADIKIQ